VLRGALGFYKTVFVLQKRAQCCELSFILYHATAVSLSPSSSSASSLAGSPENRERTEMQAPHPPWQLPTHAAGCGARHDEQEPAPWPAPTGGPRRPTGNCADAPVAQAVVLDALPSVGSAPKRKRQQLAVSCLACRRSKKQCSEELPCSRCLRLGIEDECQAPARMRSTRGPRASHPSAAAQPVALLERPVRARSCAVRFPEYAVCRHAGPSAPWRERVRASPKCSWAMPVISRLVDYGWSGDWVLGNLLLPLPVDVNEGLRTACLAVGVASLMHNRFPAVQIAPAGGGATAEGDEHHWHLMDEVYENSRHAVIRMGVSPTDGTRTRTSCNPAVSALLLTHPEELSARLAGCQIENPTTEFEGLAFVCSLVASAREASMTRYLRFRPVPRRITFVRMTVLRAFDSQGRNCRIEHHMTQVSLEEVDRALATAPHQVLIFGMDPEAHRPLTASSLVRSCDYDRHEGQISRMVQTSYGRARCRVFAVWGCCLLL